MRTIQRFIYSMIIVSTVISCEKNNDIELDYSNIRIKSISGIGDFEYEEDKITSIGSEKFVYNSSKQLDYSRIYQMDTVYGYDINTGEYGTISFIEEKLEKYSYIWENNRVVGRLIDSLMDKTIKEGGIYNLSLETNMPSAEYFYSGDRLDSILFHKPINDKNVRKAIFEYNANGNVTKAVEFYYYNPIQSFPIQQSYTESVTEFYSYDNKPNPYNLIFEKYGIIFNKLEGKNISKNNPTSSKTRVKYNDDWLEINNSFDYEYDSNGLPTKIISNKETMSEKTTTIEYN